MAEAVTTTKARSHEATTTKARSHEATTTKARRHEGANEDTFKGVAGFNIFFRSWQPQSEVRAVVVISHGFNSHSGHYLWVGEQLATNGFATYALDHRGRGKSDGDRYYVERFADYVADLATFIRLIKSREPGLSVYLLGHSAGGVISCGYALEHQDEINGLICESFAFQVPAPDFALAVIKGISHLAPHAHVLRLKIDDFSRDPNVVKAMWEDPFVADEVQPTQTVAEMVRGDERLDREFPLITLPVLIMHGTDDKVTKPSGSQKFYDNAGSQDKTLKFYKGHYHDLLNDVGKETVMADIMSWIDARLNKDATRPT
jgi:acylglycerol lipase